MTNKEKFEGFDFSHNAYEKEDMELWGNSAVDESNAKIDKLSKLEQKEFAEKVNAIFKNLAGLPIFRLIQKKLKPQLKSGMCF